MRASFENYLEFLLISFLAAFGIFAVLVTFTAFAAIILGIAIFVGANLLWFHNNHLDKYEEFIPIVLSIYLTAIYEDELSHDLAMAKIVEFRYAADEVTQQRLIQDTKQLGDLWTGTDHRELIQFNHKNAKYLAMTREEQELIYLVYLIYCQGRGIVPTPSGNQRIKREIAKIYAYTRIRYSNPYL